MNKTIFTLVLVMLFLSSILFSSVNAFTFLTADSNRQKRISFGSYIYIDYDITPLKKPLDIDQSINIPLNITYKTDVPEDFLDFLPGMLALLKNLFLYGKMIGPTQTITLDILRQPDWADITLAQNKIIVGFPSRDEISVEQTSLIVSPYEEAPAQPYTITIKASSKQVGRITSFSTEIDIVFTPSFVPTVTITAERPTRMVKPQEAVNFNIAVINEANKKARITPRLITSSHGWSPMINPPFFDILPGQKETFIFSVYAPFDFGWHDTIESFQIDFTTQIFPLRNDAPIGGPYSIHLQINNYGFSTPGFELLSITVAFGCIRYLFRKKILDEKEETCSLSNHEKQGAA